MSNESPPAGLELLLGLGYGEDDGDRFLPLSVASFRDGLAPASEDDPSYRSRRFGPRDCGLRTDG